MNNMMLLANKNNDQAKITAEIDWFETVERYAAILQKLTQLCKQVKCGFLAKNNNVETNSYRIHFILKQAQKCMLSKAVL